MRKTYKWNVTIGRRHCCIDVCFWREKEQRPSKSLSITWLQADSEPGKYVNAVPRLIKCSIRIFHLQVHGYLVSMTMYTILIYVRSPRAMIVHFTVL